MLTANPKIDFNPPAPLNWKTAREYLKKDQDCRMVALTKIKSNKGTVVHRGTHIKVNWESAIQLIEEETAIPLSYLLDRELIIAPVKGHA